MSHDSYFAITTEEFLRMEQTGDCQYTVHNSYLIYHVKAEFIGIAYNKFLELYADKKVIKIEQVWLKIL